MELRINGRTIDGATIAREAALHAHCDDADGAARRALAVRELLLERAGEAGMLEAGRPHAHVTLASRDDEDAVIGRLLEREVDSGEPTADECRAFYDAHPDRFTSGDLVEAAHILFAVTPRTPVAALRVEAERTLQHVLREPSAFGERARALSNCRSGEQGGNLGQFGRGTMVPEFDRAVFGTEATGVLPELVATRYGFHVVQVERRIPGRALPYERAEPKIARHLRERRQERALRDYVRALAARAEIEGVRFFDLPQSPADA
jgi:peptidyl-prolyl cis-trans isomerase C